MYDTAASLLRTAAATAPDSSSQEALIYVAQSNMDKADKCRNKSEMKNSMLLQSRKFDSMMLISQQLPAPSTVHGLTQPAWVGFAQDTDRALRKLKVKHVEIQRPSEDMLQSMRKPSDRKLLDLGSRKLSPLDMEHELNRLLQAFTQASLELSAISDKSTMLTLENEKLRNALEEQNKMVEQVKEEYQMGVDRFITAMEKRRDAESLIWGNREVLTNQSHSRSRDDDVTVDASMLVSRFDLKQ